MSNAEEAKFTLKVMVNKEKTKVLFAEADSHFTDILLSFLTLPLGRIVKVLEKHYGDEAPSIGSLNTLYHSLANLDSAHFCTEGAKMALLDPITLFVLDYECLKLDVSNSPPANYSSCSKCNEPPTVSIYYNEITYCMKCGKHLMKREEVAEKGSQTAAGTDDGAFTKTTTNFIIYDDLRISANVMGLLQTISILGITDMDSAKLMNVSFGLTEIMNLLKASLVSQTPLSDLILNRNKQMTSTTVGFKLETTSTREAVDEDEEASTSKEIILKMMVQKSSGKFLYAQAEEDFVELLFSFLVIPLGGVECLLAGETSIKSIDNLYRSVADAIDEKYFKTKYTKSRLIERRVPHGYVSKNNVLPLLQEWVSSYRDIPHDKFPKGRGVFLNGPITYHVTDDLTVTPFCIASIVSHLSELKITLSDVKEVEMQIGLEEALSILKASLTSTSALTEGVLRHITI